ncbi:uncharacterized protein LOC101938932 isoform X2 [Chrysemys picta bellii]|uniref:uncharacterized protein LOC101938932 isoform X2 n=1 Tax=Chrysemys picta bellii TaxID=8478 RepID=UPI0032B2B2BA
MRVQVSVFLFLVLDPVLVLNQQAPTDNSLKATPLLAKTILEDKQGAIVIPTPEVGQDSGVMTPSDPNLDLTDGDQDAEVENTSSAATTGSGGSSSSSTSTTVSATTGMLNAIVLWSLFPSGPATVTSWISSCAPLRTKSRVASPLVGSRTSCSMKQSFKVSRNFISAFHPEVKCSQSIWG